MTVGSAFPGFVVKNYVDDVKNGIVSFTIYSPSGNIFNSDGELVKIFFDTFLPTSKDSNDKTDFIEQVTATGNLCVNISDTTDNTELQPTCVYNLRWINVPGTQYSFDQINPNPVGSAGTELHFSVALEGWTEIGIYNSNGDLIAKPVAENLKPGSYNVEIPADGLESGAYFCRMVSGPFTDVKAMIVKK